MVRKLFLHDVGISDENLYDGFGESFHVTFPYLWVGTFQLVNDIEALCELSEDVHYGV